MFVVNMEFELDNNRYMCRNWGELTSLLHKEFNYVDMIKDLINTKSLEEPEMDGDFTDSEIDSIKTMIKHINTDVSEFYSDNEG